MDTIKGTLDYVEYKNKPTKTDTAIIQQNMKKEETIVDKNIEEWLEEILLGKTIRPVVFDKDRNFVSQQLFPIDIDNSEDGSIATIEDIIEISKKYGIMPAFFYETFSSSLEKTKFRPVFVAKEPITNPKHASFIIETLISLFPQADKVVKDLSRLYYGTDGKNKKSSVLDKDARFTLEDIINIHNSLHSVSNTPPKDDLEKRIKEFDLLGYMKKDNEVDRENDNIVYFKTCSICGHKDCLCYYKKSNSFYCFGANGSLGGNIIEYLMSTKEFDRKTAVKYFLSEILGLDINTKSKFDDSEIRKKYLEVIKKQLEEKKIPSDEITNVDWLNFKPAENGIVCIVKCPLLANVIRKHLHCLVVGDNLTKSVMRYVYLNGCYRLQSDNSFKGIIKLYIPIEYHESKTINEVYNLLSTDLSEISMSDLNVDENIINFQNGILDINTGELLEHSPKYYSTIQLPLNYIENVEHPKTNYFDNFMDDFTEKNDGIKKLLLQFMGVCISSIPGYRMKKALFLIGKGNTGKTQIKDFCTRLLGSVNCSQIELKDLENQYARVDLLNKRLAGSNDMKCMNIPSLDTFKQITGGDFITANIKYGPIISFKFKGLIWMNSNDFMFFSGDRGEHVYERMVIIQCNNVIPPEKRNSYLVENLLEEKEYIVSLAIKELKNVIKNGYKYDIPECCKEINRQYQVDNNSWLSFMRECTVDRSLDEPIPADAATKATVFKVYKEYCKDYNSNHFERKSEVKKILAKLGKDGEVYANGGNIYYAKFKLSDRTMEEYRSITNYCSGIHVQEFNKLNDVDDDVFEDKADF